MYGHNPPGHRTTAAGGGSGRGGAVPPLQALPPTPNYFIQNVNPYFQNPTFQANLGLPYLQNPTLPTQNPTLPTQNPTLPTQNPTLPMQNTNLPLQNPNLPMQNASFPLQNPSFAIQNTNFTGFRPQPPKRNKEALDRVDGAVVKARRDVIAAGESVSAWKVSQSALLALQVDSWESLGFPMQEVPSLHSLIVIEGKINSFIHCFVGVRRITSLYDLEMAICKNEGVEQFEDLELGPLVRHPLIMHYFSISSDASGVFKITSAEIISCLDEFMEACKDKHIIIEEFLEYIAKKRSLTGRERLGVRIQSLGMHISFIREARKLEHVTLKKSQGSLKQIPDKKIREHPLRSSEKKKLDERFSAMSQRVKSFASAHDDFGGKHTIFVSSCSEEDGSDDHKYEESEEDIDGCSNSKFSSPNSKTRDRVSSCPYPSAIEEMTRLGLKGETEGNPSASGSSMHSENTGPFKRKRKSSNRSCTVSKYLKLPKRNKLELVPLSVDHENEKKELNNLNEADFLLANDSMRMFITTWKEACREHTIAEVLERMLQFHGTQTKQRKIMKSMLSSYPFVGLLNVAVTSIKSGMWDSIYDTFQAISQDELTNKLPDKHSEYESIDVEPSENDTVAITDCILEHRHSVTVEDVMRNLVTFFELDHDISHRGKSPLEKKFLLLRQLSNCEFWLAEKFSVKEFKSLGFGDFFTFLEKHASILPNELHKCLTSDTYEKSPLEVCMLQKQLVVLLSQASNSLWENETLTKQKISMLLKRQFPSVGFKILENGCMDDFLDIVREQKSCVVSTCVLFSSTLLGTYSIKDSSVHNEESLENAGTSTDIGQKTGILGPVTTKDAIEILIRAPMLSDLNSWSHWDLIFAPSLGPLVWWLLNEVNTKELLCLVTKDGKVMRIDHSATVDSFLEASLQGSSFRTAVQLLSLFSLFGGKRHVPFSLLKCHARQAFEVILRNSVENMEVNESQDSLMHGKPLFQREMLDIDAASNLSSGSQRNMSRTSKAVPVASRFLLDCLGYLPSEFRSFAADILLSGLQPFTINGPSAILDECNLMDQRVMLHEVGLSLGVMQWIDDYHAFSSAAATNSFVSSGALCLQAASSELRRGTKFTQNALAKFPSCEGEMIISDGACGHNEEHSEICQTTGSEGVSVDRSGHGCILYAPELNEHKDATLVIESIRRDEFGLDPTLSSMESSMLKKQHARLGRALHCLSQELYSQDSHFLLELVQNADDNIYPENVEPTLTFILQDRGIIVLNNEQGFSAQNIRALCDVGNSTKKGSKAGYIGQKGIGFKSVFRVTDAPEIHSNGFHVKFDISEGQIGFVLPTVIPPCNVDLFRRLASSDTDQEDTDSWNTCIVLPFRMKLSKGTGMSNIISMFSDLHPSLLLFLHHLRCIKFKNMLNDSLIIMRKEIVGDGIIKVSHGREKMTWFVISQKLRADVIRPDVQTTEIAIAFTLQESDNGEYSPHFDQQPVFAFLPLRTYGLKFILQGDFVLPSSREEVDGDSPWNQWLLSEFPGLFVTAERSFCALPCFRENPGKSVAAYMSFVPLVGEVHGFFSSLPRMIISKLRMSNCLLLEGDNNEWVPPCKVLRSWNEQARSLLPDSLLRKHLGLGFLDKNIHLSDPLARALGIQEYGPKILLQIISSLCHTEDGLKSMGLAWLSSWLNALYTMPLHYSGQSSLNSNMESDLIYDLKKIPFIPLSDGNYGSLDEGTIWLHSDSLSTELDGEHGLGAFPNLYAKLRIVNPALLSAASVDIPCMDMTLAENVTRMLHRIGVQQLSAHEIVQVHILPAMSDEGITNREKNLMIEYLSFVMVHLQSSCTNCRVEREYIISEICSKAFILTNHGYKRPVEVPIHFSKEFGNTIDVNRFINASNMTWHVVDIAYLKHPITESLSCGLMKWRGFFQALGVTDFVQIVQVEKNVSDISHMILKNEMWDRDLISHGTIAKDWESPELVQLLSILSKTGDQESCKNLLDVLDTLWDDCFSDKVTGYCNFKSSGDRKPFKSSLMTSICDFQWIASSMDDELHYPKDLFYDSDEVHLVLGSSAPYALPKVRSGKLACDIGFKTKVTLDDILGILQEWRRSETPFKASIAQMSKFYTFIWNETGTSSQKIAKEFLSGPFIFVPCASGSRHEDVVSGMLLSVEDVYWHDSTGSVDRMKEILPRCDSVGVIDHPLSKMLCNVYPGHHDFFVNGCGVHEIPSLHSYIEILVQLSAVALPSQAANAVFRVFLKWTEGLKSKTLSSEDIVYLKECLLKLEFTVLPTVQDKWVSLHPSFGLVCWCDDEKLRKEFKHSDNLDFLYFGNLSDDEKERLQAKVSVLMQTLGIPSLSEVITQEVIYYGPTDSSFKASLVNWALPYAQRYIYKRHPKKYRQFKQSGFGTLNRLRVVVVEKLFYRNIIKRCESASKKRFEASCLLQDNILYTTQESDSHSVFMELSRLLFDGTPELHLANFLHMITTMAESGSNEEQTEFFILNSQKVPKLPDEESVWSLSSLISQAENEAPSSNASTMIDEQSTSKTKEKSRVHSNWPPVDWKTAPGFSFARANGFRTRAAASQPSSSWQKRDNNDFEGTSTQVDRMVSMEINANWSTEDDSAPSTAALLFPESETMEYQFDQTSNYMASEHVNLAPVTDSPGSSLSKFSRRDQLITGIPNAHQAMLTGRLGELIAFNYLSGKVSDTTVKWVNQESETGLPYDIVIGEKETSREFIEVKATKSARKDWFIISTREWQFAVEKGDSFSIAHVVLSGNNAARITMFKNPVKLCQLGQLQLAVMIPRQQKEVSVA